MADGALSIETMNPVNATEQKAQAWVLPYAPERQIAVPFALGQELIETPELLFIPGVVNECEGLLHWRDQWLPVLNLANLFLGLPLPPNAPVYVLVVAYFKASGDVAYAGIALTEPPESVIVKSEDQYPLPSYTHKWNEWVLSCFLHNGIATPVVDVHALFR